MIKLRKYQQNGVDSIRTFLSNGGKKAIVQAPTGGGKTVIFSYIAENAIKKKRRVLILTDRSELLMQANGSLSNFGLSPSLIVAGTKYINFDSNVYIAMMQTLKNRLKKKIWLNWLKNHIDLIIIDECHLQTVNYLFESGLIDDKIVLGFSATPKRTGKMRQLAFDYEKIIPTVTVKELIDQDYLVGDDYSGVGGANLSNIKYDAMKGDYSEKDMFQQFNTPTLYAGVVKNWKEICPNTKTLVFCVNIEHVIHTCEEFQKNGIDARFLVSGMSTPKEPQKDAKNGAWVVYEEKMRLYKLYLKSFSEWSGERNRITSGFKNGEFPVLINAGILTTGYDEPTIETIIVNRATLSQTLWLQMIGRGSRISPGKNNFNILDFGDNAGRLGHYTTPQLWNLWHEASKSDGNGVPPMKDCPKCERMILVSYTICPFCGHKYPKKKEEEIDLKGLMYDNTLHKATPVKRINQMDDLELYDYFKVKGHKSAWLWRQLYFRGGTERIEEFGKVNGWKSATILKAINYAKNL